MSQSHPLTSANTFAARKWAIAGVSVFPCCPKTKKPLVKGWRNSGTDASAWDAHWNRSPGAMPGLDCGSIGIVVIDCDCRASGDGETAFRCAVQ